MPGKDGAAESHLDGHVFDRNDTFKTLEIYPIREVKEFFLCHQKSDLRFQIF
jgi:hypothetical protein